MAGVKRGLTMQIRLVFSVTALPGHQLAALSQATHGTVLFNNGYLKLSVTERFLPELSTFK